MLSMIALAGVTGCKAASLDPHEASPEAAERGRKLILREQCGACHDIPGIDWPKGRLGPALDGLKGQGLIAGTLPNSDANLARFIRNAPAVRPGTAMPASKLSESESRDVAAYLVSEGGK